MEKTQVAETILDALREVQTLGGYEWQDIPSGAKVIGSLKGFDSLTAIEATVLIEQKLGLKLGRSAPVSLGKDSIFLSNDGARALSLSEVVDVVAGSLTAKAAAA